MIKKGLATVLCMMILLLASYTGVNASAVNKNPPREELEKKIEEVARKRGIPSVILKSIARVESVFKQFNSDGSPFVSRGTIGLMQINNIYGWFDKERLKYDIDYNIDAGADVLLRKWDTAVDTLPQIGDMNPNVLENWYFAIWAYNGWSKSNNPNTGLKKQAYQDLVYYIAEKEYGQKITPIDKSLLPKQGLPSKNTIYNTPSEHHYGDILFYDEGDIVRLDGRQYSTLKATPNGSDVAEISNLDELQVLEGPVLNGGYFWYKVRANNVNKEGWLVGNWISKTGSIYPFLDISRSWSKEYIIKLHELNIVSGDGRNFNPNNQITRQEMCVMLSRALQLESAECELEFTDANEIDEWAIPHVIAVTKADIMTGCEEANEFRPVEYITREEAAIIISRTLGYDDNLDFELEYIDISDISDEALEAIKNVQVKGIMNGANGKFRPKDYLTRGEACKLIYDIINIME